MEQKFLKLTSLVYKLLEYFPESDPLKHRAKDRALAIAEHPTAEDIDALLGYLWIAKTQGWLSSANFLIISNEYENVKPDKSQRHFDGPATISPKASLGGKELPGRQKQILEFLNKNEKAQVMDLQAVLGNITKRTIRRDLDELLLAGKIVRFGEFNNVVYKIKG